MSSTNLTEAKYNMKSVWSLSFNASLGNFILGYNMGVFTSCQPCVSATLEWGSNKDIYIMFMAAILSLGAMFGSMCSGTIARRYGRRKALMITDMLIIIGCGITIIPYTPGFAIGRIVTGFAVGIYTCVVPIYIRETAPVEVAGKVGGLVQLQITSGIVISYCLALALPTNDYDSDPLNYLWMALFGFQSLFAVLQFFILLTIFRRDTPQWLVEKGRYDEALVSLKDIYNDNEADTVFKRLKSNNKRSVVEVDRQSLIKGDEEPSYGEIIKCQNGLSKMVRLGILISLFQQFSGINAILSFSTTIFNSIGGTTFMSRVYTCVVGIVNMASTLGIFPLVERTGRKKLTLIGGVGMTVCLFLMGFFYDIGKDLGHAPPIICILAFIVFYEGSIGPICWIYSGEILASRAMSVCMFLNWLWTFIVILTFSPLVTLITMPGAFFVYAGVNLLGFFYFYFDMVETKGLDKGQIWTLLVKKQNL
ncbi:hypothetical protein SteCoe_603 [Stentor coeruleus]|uniref:Hexose transporter 1 n=1 Tax=Stentor coeruleus TaxID=5963 RepID=A0A1R2D3T6_9CILI|nr:hypothetical protein SteCoe_603 [Stentor coeruleus]